MLSSTPVDNGQVNISQIHDAAEGFGYGSTIVGLEQALTIDSNTSGDTANFGSSFQLAKTHAFTQEFLLYPHLQVNTVSASSSYRMYQWLDQSSSSQGYVSTYNSGHGIHVGGPAGDQDVNNVLNVDAWNEITQTYDGTHLQLYVNGVLVQTTTGVATGNFTEPAQIQLGNTGGAFDEFRVWNVARTEAEIQNSKFVPLTGQEKGLVGYWQFNGNLNDSTGNAPSFTGGALYTQNAQPQVGWVDVTVSKPVTAETGLFVQYAITGGTATQSVDYDSSRLRIVSDDPTTEMLGIIIPKGETKGRINFVVRTDAIYEPTETVNVQLVPYTFSNNTYSVGAAAASLSIADSGAYLTGVGLFDVQGRSFAPDAAGVIPYASQSDGPVHRH